MRRKHKNGSNNAYDITCCRNAIKSLCFGRFHIDETTTVLTFGEHNNAVNQSIDRVILAHAHIQTGMMHSATLTFDDVTGFAVLTAKNLDAESFAF